MTRHTIYGLLIAWNGVLVVCTELPLTSLTLRLNARQVMAVGYVLIGLGFGLNACALLGLMAAATTLRFGKSTTLLEEKPERVEEPEVVEV